MQNVDIRRYRGLRSSEYFDEGTNTDTPSDASGNPSHDFQLLRIVTRDENLSGERLDDFFSAFRKGMDGYADISGNNDGLVQAEELAYYIRDNAGVTMEIARNGNASHVLAKANKSLNIPDGLFQELSSTFTRDEFRKERDSALQRETRLRHAKGGVQ